MRLRHAPEDLGKIGREEGFRSWNRSTNLTQVSQMFGREVARGLANNVSFPRLRSTEENDSPHQHTTRWLLLPIQDKMPTPYQKSVLLST